MADAIQRQTRSAAARTPGISKGIFGAAPDARSDFPTGPPPRLSGGSAAYAATFPFGTAEMTTNATAIGPSSVMVMSICA